MPTFPYYMEAGRSLGTRLLSGIKPGIERNEPEVIDACTDVDAGNVSEISVNISAC